MSDGTFTLRPYEVRGQSRCAVFADRQPPVDGDYRVPPGTAAELADYVRALRSQPVNQAAATMAASNAPAPEMVTIGRARGRHTASAASTSPPPEHPAAVGVLEHDDDPVPEDNEPPHLDHDPELADDASDVVVHIPQEGVDFQRNRKGRRVFPYYSAIGSDQVAIDADGHDFTDADGNLIYVTHNGVAVDDRTAVSDLVRKGKTLLRTGGASSDPLADDTPDLYDENGVPVEHFPVPAVGKSPVVTSRVWGGRRLVFLLVIVVAVGALVGSCGLLVGRSAVPANGVISAEEQSTYRLSDLPAQAMAAFGQQYLQTCLTHGDATQVEARAKMLAAMTTGGVSDLCGWQSGGKVQVPQMIQWTGRFTPMEGFNTGRAAFFYFTVSMDSGEYSTVSVPIWVNTAEQSNDMAVVGDLGITAGIREKMPEAYTAPGSQDSALATELQSTILEPFFTAWSASDARQIAIIAASDATAEVRDGLHGTYTNPEITAVQVYTTYDTSSGARIVYGPGDEVKAVVTLTWHVPSSSSTQTSGYRVTLRYNDGKWQVSDIAGGAVTDRAADTNGSSGGGTDSIDAGIAPDATGGAATTTASDAPTATAQTTDPTSDPSESAASSSEPAP